MSRPRTRPFATFVAFAAALMLTVGAVSDADARAAKSTSSSGSRGARTQDAPAPTATAPNTIAPSTAAPTAAAPKPAATAAQPAAAAAAQKPGGFFSRGGFGGMLMGGLLGAGIAGLLFGGGFLDGLGSLAGMLGFLLQVAVIGFLVMLAVRFFRNRAGGGARPAYAGAEALNRQGMDQRPSAGLGGLMGGLGGAAPRPPVQREAADEIGLTAGDFDGFERLLVAVQDAYTREDRAGLAGLATAEMAAHLSGELDANLARGVLNKVSDVRLLQGDLSESWREPGVEYATVAMRFALIDVTVERASGRVVDGDPSHGVEATEIWTFRRPPGGAWVVSAIQQA